MLKKLGLLPLLIFASGLANAQSVDSVWIGTWNMNAAQSTLHQPAPKSESVEISAPGGRAHVVNYKLTGTTADGTAFERSFDGASDGKPYPVMSNGQQAGTQIWHRQSSTHYTNEETGTDGSKSSSTLIMAPGGKSFTITEHVTGPNGTFDQKSVWNKQ